MEIEATYLQQFNPKRGLVYVPDLIIDGVKTAIQGAKQYDTKTEAISEAQSVIKRYLSKNLELTKVEKTISDYDKPNKVALASLKLKMEAVRDTIDTKTEDEFGDWIDSLTFDEFMELIRLGEA